MPLRASFTSRQLSLLIFALFAFTLPFELNTPWLTLGPLVLTNVEIMLALCLLMAGWLSWRHPLADKRPFPRWFLFLIASLSFTMSPAIATVSHAPSINPA